MSGKKGVGALGILGSSLMFTRNAEKDAADRLAVLREIARTEAAWREQVAQAS